MSITLEMPSKKHWDSYKLAFPGIDSEGDVTGMNWDGESTPEKYFQDALDMKEGRNLGDLVPCTNFWIIADEKYVGRMSIRHELNDWLRTYGGHIGYEVIESERKKGYATKALKLAIEYAKSELLLKSVMLTCDDDNIASINFCK